MVELRHAVRKMPDFPLLVAKLQLLPWPLPLPPPPPLLLLLKVEIGTRFMGTEKSLSHSRNGTEIDLQQRHQW